MSFDFFPLLANLWMKKKKKSMKNVEE